ncbi:hypothetical protein [Candidatus Poriferisodalis sp.]|uniref:hypothetical protein n=1 Tax=Candidatus Poriferisodalis sp. TaxID=3101277 RepID=UPI003B012075
MSALVGVILVACGMVSSGCLMSAFEKRVDAALDDVLPALERLCGVALVSDQLPTVAESSLIDFGDIFQEEDRRREYLLYNAMGGVVSDYDSYASEITRRSVGHLGFYDDRSHSIWVRSDIDDGRFHEVIAHELTHAWVKVQQPLWRLERPRRLSDSPDAHLARLGIEEGFAMECVSRYRKDRWDRVYRDVEKDWFVAVGEPQDTTVMVDPRTFDFIDRASGWIPSLADGFREQYLRDVVDFGTVVNDPSFSQIQTAHLLSISEVPRDTQFGALLLREALTLHGVPWPNAEAVARSVGHDEFEITEAQSGRLCSVLRLVFENGQSFPARWLSPRDAMSKWAASASKQVEFEGDDQVLVSECISFS